MKIELLTLDCAETLVGVKWAPGPFACDVMAEIGHPLPEGASDRYNRLYAQRMPDFRAANQSPDPADIADFWLNLSRDWLKEVDLDPELAEEVREVARVLLYEDPNRYFPLFPDTLPALHALSERNVRMAVLSNWDESLARILAAHGIDHFFEGIHASLPLGVEKPDPAFFLLVSELHSVPPAQTLHVGDNPIDDLLGARNAGCNALLLDRSESRGPHSLGSLVELVERWV